MTWRGASICVEFSAGARGKPCATKKNGGERVRSHRRIDYAVVSQLQLPDDAVVFAAPFFGMLTYPVILSLLTELTTNSSG